MTPDDRIDLAERIERRADNDTASSYAAITRRTTLRKLAAEIRDGSFWENDDD